jgi:hypothetical protein
VSIPSSRKTSPPYCDVTIRRWQAYTGKSATLAATGQAFEEVEETRRAANDDKPLQSAQTA